MIVNKEAVSRIMEEIKPATLVVATKYVGIKEIEELEKLGVTIFGENRVQAFLEKYNVYHGKGTFHMIGTLQPNKVKYIIDKVSLIHSVDSLSLIKEIEKQAAKHNLVMKILLQVNISKEESKHGFDKEELEAILEYLTTCKHIEVNGLMTMAPNMESSKTSIYFKQMQELLHTLQQKFPQFPLKELSMGMSNDYQEAVACGATMVRIGSAVFK